MTLDELTKVYDKAASDVAFLQYEGPDHRAGLKAVVEALRDEVAAIEGWSGAKERIDEVFKKILASDGVDEKAKLPELQSRMAPLTGIRRTVRSDVVFEPDEAAGADTAAKSEAIARSSPATDRIEALEANLAMMRDYCDELWRAVDCPETGAIARFEKAEAEVERLRAAITTAIANMDHDYAYEILCKALEDNIVSELEREELNEILASDGVKSEGSE
jgi:hypothetical protein